LAALSVICLAPIKAQIPDGITFTPAFGTDGANHFTHPANLIEIPGKPGYFVVPEMGSGKIWVLAPGASGYTKTQFGVQAGNAADEDMGLTGFAFHPDYADNRKYYVKYGGAQRPPRRNFIDERLAAADLLHDSGTPGRRLLTVDEPDEFSDHNGGSPVFGPDGYLYIGFGDGGWDQITPDVRKNGQNRESLLAKVLRIDVNRKDPGLEYGIPADNPFVSDPNPNVRREIYAYGLRNPYRMSFDRLTKELYVGDVGWTRFDEVDVVKKGGNYGWSLKEASFCLTAGACDGAAIEDPLASMANGSGPGMAKCVIGGQVYRGDPASPFYGVYLYGDYTLKKLFAIKKPASGPATVKEYPIFTPEEPIAFTLDQMNNIYMVGYSGTIFKLTHAQLAPMAAIGIGPAARLSRAGARPVLAVLSGDGLLSLPPGLEGRYEAVSPEGRRLGILSREGNREATLPSGALSGSGVAILRPVSGR
jgi:glucose/arabinose dehydrogenase